MICLKLKSLNMIKHCFPCLYFSSNNYIIHGIVFFRIKPNNFDGEISIVGGVDNGYRKFQGTVLGREGKVQKLFDCDIIHGFCEV